MKRKTTALQVDNRGYAYEARNGDDALIVALNIDDAPMALPIATLIAGQAQLVGGTAAPPEEVVDEVVVPPPQGWLVLRPL